MTDFKFAEEYKLGASISNHLPLVELTPAQAKSWTESRARFLFQCPAFSHILYEMMKTKDGGVALFTNSPAIPYAATDGQYLIINPEEFFKWDVLERTFVIAHEVLHCVFRHCEMNHAFRKRDKVVLSDGTELPYNDKLMNVAEDYVINAMLVDARVGKMPTNGVNGEQIGLYDVKIGTAKDAPIDVYARLWKEQEKNGGAGGQGQGPQGFDTCLQPGLGNGAQPDQAVMQRNQTKWKLAIAQANAIGKAQGDQSANLDRMFGDLMEPTVNWRDHIQSLFARKVGNGGFDWRRADRRMITRDEPIFAPGRSGNGCGTIVMGVDTSGSINDTILNVFFGEMAGILEELRPKRLVVMWCDACVQRVDEIEDASDLPSIRSKGAPGGGGTSFVPVFEKIAEMGLEPEALVYLTDGYGSFPANAPSYPMIWGNITKGYQYPFGDVVDVVVE